MNKTLYYQGGTLDRGHGLRNQPEQLAQRWNSDHSRVVLLHQGKSLFRVEQDLITPVLLTPRELLPFTEHNEPVFLGSDQGLSYFAVAVTDAHATTLTEQYGAKFIDLRSVTRQLSHADAALLAYARGLIHWRNQTRYCSVCGSELAASAGGHVLTCTQHDCAQTFFPRTDPAVIMLVESRNEQGERQCLLGRHPNWQPGLFSTLAGFVEPGESLEEAVRREVAEEAGIRVGEVRYLDSQPWPFPASIMLGFFAQADTTTITLDPEELAEADWFTAQQLLNFGEWGDNTKHYTLPRRDSIARRLIDLWLTQSGD